jgi:hypothetical protein
MAACTPTLENADQLELFAKQFGKFRNFLKDSKFAASTVKVSCDKCYEELQPRVQNYNASSVKDLNELRFITRGYYKCMYGQEYGSDKSINPIPCAPLLDSLEQQVEFPIHIEEYTKPLSDGSGADMKFKPACNDCLAKLQPLVTQVALNPTDKDTFKTLSQGLYQCVYGREYGTPVWVYILSSVGGVLLVACIVVAVWYYFKRRRQTPTDAATLTAQPVVP